MQAFDELVSDEPLAGELAHPHADLEIDAGVSERVEQHQRRLIEDPAFGFTEDFASHLKRYRLHHLEVTVVADPHVYAHPERGARQAKVLHY